MKRPCCTVAHKAKRVPGHSQRSPRVRYSKSGRSVSCSLVFTYWHNAEPNDCGDAAGKGLQSSVRTISPRAYLLSVVLSIVDTKGTIAAINCVMVFVK
jgi:hypothetical protein